jgi:hypothetical protein
MKQEKQPGVGRYELAFDGEVYHLAGTKTYKTIKHFVRDASKNFILKDAEGGLKLGNPIDRETIERRRSVSYN